MDSRNSRLVVLVIRFFLGALFLMVGLGRLVEPGLSSFVARLQRQFAETPLPDLFLQVFGRTLPFVEGTIGALLFVGLYRRASFVSVSLLLVVLTLGQMMIRHFDMAANNAVYLLVALLGLGLLGEPTVALDGMRSSPEQG